MTKHNVPMSDYDDSGSGGYVGQEPKRGVYEGKLVSVKDHTSGQGNDGLEWKFEITKGEYTGWRGYSYSNLDSTLWKTQQTLHAITGSKKDAVIDTDKDGAKMVKKAKPVMMRVVTEQYEGEPRAKLKVVLPIIDNDEDGDDDENDDPFA